jgi:peptidyl-prolyl cis-trans isomerase B (cyclophilin B)
MLYLDKPLIIMLISCCAILIQNQAWAAGQEGKEQSKNPVVAMKTSEGTIRIELWADKAPVTVKNFLQYADEGAYDGTIFHRVINDFMIQGGGFTPDMGQKPTHEPIKNEAAADLKNARGTIAMARTNVVDSATSQFFLNVKDNDFLDHKNESPTGFGYAVFGKVIEGMDVVDRIKAVQTTRQGMYQDVPVKPIVIESVKRDK